MCVSKQVVNQGQDLEIGKQDTFSSFIDNFNESWGTVMLNEYQPLTY